MVLFTDKQTVSPKILNKFKRRYSFMSLFPHFILDTICSYIYKSNLDGQNLPWDRPITRIATRFCPRYLSTKHKRHLNGKARWNTLQFLEEYVKMQILIWESLISFLSIIFFLSLYRGKLVTVGDNVKINVKHALIETKLC